MKIRTRKLPLTEVLSLPRPPHRKPVRPHPLLRGLIRLLCIPSLHKTRFTYRTERMELVGDQPCLILMNHSSFTDLKVAQAIFYPRPLNIVSTTDGFVGLATLMRLIGCIPTRKFVSDLQLMGDIRYALTELKSNVLLFPEAGYTLDGRSTVLPRHFGAVLKRLRVPVVMINTWGAFARDPLYNGLQLRRVKVEAEVRCLFTPEELKARTLEEIDREVEAAFTFDQFAWQKEKGVRITEPFRADGLNRVLYKCCHCGCEGQMEGKGTHLTCGSCGKTWELDELGQLHATDGGTRFPHIPDWFDYQRQEVRRELENGEYLLDTEVDVGVLVDYKAMYMTGRGRLTQTRDGITLRDEQGNVIHQQDPLASHSLNVDYFWYEIGDMIAIGGPEAQYCCFPRQRDVVTRARLAAEETYRMQRG